MIDRWFDAFRGDPEQAVADLFSGRAGVASSLRLDVPDLLYQAFPQHLVSERTELDKALLSWLLGMHEQYSAQVKRLGFSVYGKRVGDALIALQLLDLSEARRQIRADLDAWLRWLSPLRLAPERDPALECFRLLTRGQPDAGHTAMWLRLATDPRPEYLTVSLAGLRLLPNQHNAQTNQTLMLQALLRHAVQICHEVGAARTFFNRRFAALRGHYPRGPQYWKHTLSEALDNFVAHTQEQLASELVDVLRTEVTTKPRHSKRSQTSTQAPVSQKKWRGLERDIDGPSDQPETLARRLFELLEQNHGYAEATGVSHFFVRTLHNLGSSLLKRHELGQAEMVRFGVMIERALVWEPANPYCWMLWADWFRTQGRHDAHESTLREILRLFPNDLHARVELGLLLIRRGEYYWDEARYWLQQVMDRDPGNEHSRVVMARLLVLRERPEEAKALLFELLEKEPENPKAREFLNQMRSGLQYAADDDTSDAARENEVPGTDDGVHSSVPPPGALTELFRRGHLGGEFSRARIAKAQGGVAPTDLIRAETRRGDPLAGFYSQWLMPNDTPACPPHAWAWNACRYWQDSASPDSWTHLAAQFPEAAMETDFLHILAVYHEDNQARVAAWRNRYNPDVDTASPAAAFMREAMGRIAAISAHERDEIAVTVLACAAAGAPEFALEQPA